MFPVNCYVLWDDTKEAVVIDPGCFYEEEKQALKKFILTNELNVKHLLNTHLHLDHIFGNPFMLKEFGLSAEANKAECLVFSCRKNLYHWANTCMTEISSLSDIPNWKQYTCPDIHPAAWCTIAKKTTACSPVTSCSKAASAVLISQEATSMN